MALLPMYVALSVGYECLVYVNLAALLLLWLGITETAPPPAHKTIDVFANLGIAAIVLCAGHVRGGWGVHVGPDSTFPSRPHNLRHRERGVSSVNGACVTTAHAPSGRGPATAAQRLWGRNLPSGSHSSRTAKGLLRPHLCVVRRLRAKQDESLWQHALS